MKVKTFSYRFAEEILQHSKYRCVYDEIMMVCKECPLPVYQGKSKNQPRLDVVQQVMNSYFFKRLELLGWETEPAATPDENADELRSDFRKTFVDKETGEKLLTVQIEVEFGNVASSYRNYFKFQLSYSYSLTDICIIIVPSQQLANRVDSGVSNFEKACRELPSAKLSITVPTLVIGLFDEDTPIWDVKEIEQDLAVLKNSSRTVYERHYKIIGDYISSL